MAAEQVHFIYMGRGRCRVVVPSNATHVTIHDSITVIHASSFSCHKNIVELICHEGVKIIEEGAFYNCPRLKRVIIPGVRVIIRNAFGLCTALTYVECPKLETIGGDVFYSCKSLRSINLQSVKIVGGCAFAESRLTDVEFGMSLESMGERTFRECRWLERIKIPMKHRLFHYSTFTECPKLTYVDLVERVVLHETIDALLMDDWRDDINREIATVKNQSLPVAYAGFVGYSSNIQEEKVLVIKEWIGRVLLKIVGYKAQHRRILEEAASTLGLFLPCDIVLNNIISFLELPPHTFDGEDECIDEELSVDRDGRYGEYGQENDHSAESQYSNEWYEIDEDDGQEDDYSDESPRYSSDSDGNDEKDGHEDYELQYSSDSDDSYHL